MIHRCLQCSKMTLCDTVTFDSKDTSFIQRPLLLEELRWTVYVPLTQQQQQIIMIECV